MLSLEHDEGIQLEVRKHWLQITIESLGIGIAALAVPIGAFVIDRMFLIFTEPASVALFLFFYTLWLLLLWAVFFIGWTTYYLDIWIVTNKRLVDFDQRALFVRKTAILRLENIQDVEVEIDGILHTLLGLGRIRVQTAGANPTFIINYARNPHEAKERIIALVEARRREVREQN